MNVLVLLGGASPERKVSLVTGGAIADALEARGHAVTRLDPGGGGDAVLAIVDAVRRATPDVVFVALHGGEGEGGHVQAVLDLAGVPYTGSGVTGSVVAMDKALSKELFVQHDIPTAPWRVLGAGEGAALGGAIEAVGNVPVVIKPVRGGSTVATSIVREAADADAAFRAVFEWDHEALIEAFVPGRELTVGVLGVSALPVVEIVPESGFYDYESKYTAGRSRYVVPAEVSPAVAAEAQSLAERAVRVLRCNSGSRVDFRLDGDRLFCLEVNTVPGMTPTSLLPMAAKAVGMDFGALVERLCGDAVESTGP